MIRLAGWEPERLSQLEKVLEMYKDVDEESDDRAYDQRFGGFKDTRDELCDLRPISCCDIDREDRNCDLDAGGGLDTEACTDLLYRFVVVSVAVEELLEFRVSFGRIFA